eukprot:532136-Lingulodinium_polyedra.AAC.1
MEAGERLAAEEAAKPPLHPELSEVERGNGYDKCYCAVLASLGVRRCQGPRKPWVDDDNVASRVAERLG